MNKLIFPSDYEKHRYGNIHLSFFLEYAKLAGLQIDYDVNQRVFCYFEKTKWIFSCVINDQQVIFDYGDHVKNYIDEFLNIPYFKFQVQNDKTKAIPVGPLFVKNPYTDLTTDWFLDFREQFQYKHSKKILSKQIPHKDRRVFVQSLLEENFPATRIDIKAHEKQAVFWKKHEVCAGAICVPGSTNNMLDRGQYELMLLGVPTISPHIKTRLPWNLKLESGKHYLKCKDDFSDVIEKAKILQNNPNLCYEISKNARELFESYCCPEKYWQWILKNTG